MKKETQKKMWVSDLIVVVYLILIEPILFSNRVGSVLVKSYLLLLIMSLGLWAIFQKVRLLNRQMTQDEYSFLLNLNPFIFLFRFIVWPVFTILPLVLIFNVSHDSDFWIGFFYCILLIPAYFMTRFYASKNQKKTMELISPQRQWIIFAGLTFFEAVIYSFFLSFGGEDMTQRYDFIFSERSFLIVLVAMTFLYPLIFLPVSLWNQIEVWAKLPNKRELIKEILLHYVHFIVFKAIPVFLVYYLYYRFGVMI